MKISYLITCSSEEDSLQSLLDYILKYKHPDDEIVPLIDLENGINSRRILDTEFKGTFDTRDISIVSTTSGKHHFNDNTGIYKVYGHGLSNDYGSHKNFGVEKCLGDWIFQLDGDELPPESLIGENLHSLIESNPTVEAYAIPRINAFYGLDRHHRIQWGWNLDISQKHNRLRVNWPDYQFRIFKNISNIRFQRKLHEKIEGYKKYSILPADEDYAIDHIKTIERQIQTNIMYNRLFSKTDNEGHKIS